MPTEKGTTINDAHVKALKELTSCPGMPVFVLRNKGIDIVYKKDMLETKYHDKLDAIEQKMFNEKAYAAEVPQVVLPTIQYPDIEFALKLTKSETFSLFNDEHLVISGQLITLFMGVKKVDELIALGVYCRERLNAFLFIYCWTSALLHREDTRGIRMPDITENMPSKYFQKWVVNDSRRVIYMTNVDRPIIKLRTENAVTNISDEARMSYFREDIAINQHHYHWHIIYPFTGPFDIVNKDRRGELFYFMHNQVLHRMDNDRYCQGIPAVTPLKLGQNATCASGYYPKLDTSLGSRYISGRPDNVSFPDVHLDGSTLSQTSIGLWMERIMNAIMTGFVTLPNNELLKLTPENGIDIIGNLIEASSLSYNRMYYGSMHNNGHLLIARCHDPSTSNKEEPGVMADTNTAMRDPIFYQWHRAIDDLFREYKSTLPIYKKDDFEFPGIKVGVVQIVKDRKETKSLETFWEWDDINCSRGLDYKTSTPVYIRFKHLNHDEWEFHIDVTNSLPTAVIASVRIWLVPVNDFARRNLRLVRSQNLSIEMDKFVAKINPGRQTVVRKSEDSTVTIPFSRAFPHAFGQTAEVVTSDTAYCTCGWPHYMHLPIGSMNGIPFNVVVMLTPFEKDRTDSDDVGIDASSYCGLRNKKYPDKRPMGFPFDRQFDTKYAYLKDFVDDYDNIHMSTINIVHKNEERKGRYLMGEL